MNQQTLNFLNILQGILHRKTPELIRPDWAVLFQMASHHNLLPAVYNTVSNHPSFSEAPEDVKKSFLKSAVGQSGGQFIRTQEFLSLCDSLQEEGLVPLELHVNPFGLETGIRRQMNNLFADPFRRAVSLDIEGHTIYTLCPTEHYLFLFCHLYKHFIGGGVGIRHVMDLLLFRQTWEEEIDFQEVLSGIRKVNGEPFYQALLEIGRR